jgi:hypothetical protein
VLCVKALKKMVVGEIVKLRGATAANQYQYRYEMNSHYFANCANSRILSVNSFYSESETDGCTMRREKLQFRLLGKNQQPVRNWEKKLAMGNMR